MLRWVLMGVVALAAAPTGASGWPGGPESLYVVNSGSNSVSAFKLRPNGVPRRVACRRSTLDCPSGSQPVAIAASGRFVYVANEGSGTISPFAVEQHGRLRPIPCGDGCSLGPSPEPDSEVLPTHLAVDPYGRFLFVAAFVNIPTPHVPGGVVVFRIAADGSLTRVPCDADCFGTGLLGGLTVDPTGRFLYGASEGAPDATSPGFLALWRIGSAGALTRVDCDESGQCRTGALPHAPAIDPTGEFLYLTSGFLPQEQPGTVEVFSLGADGRPTKLPCTPATRCQPGGGAFQADLALHPSGTLLYTVDDSVSAFHVDGGDLSPIPCLVGDCSAGSAASAIAIEPRGRFVYVTDAGSNRLLAYAIRPDGSLVPIGCRTPGACDTGQDPQDLVIIERHKEH